MTTKLTENTMDKNALLAAVSSQPHKATDRGLYPDDIERLIAALPEAKRRVRVYSADGFVPNKYKWPCWIHWLEAVRDAETGEWKFHFGRTGAQRSHGNGSLLVVQ